MSLVILSTVFAVDINRNTLSLGLPKLSLTSSRSPLKSWNCGSGTCNILKRISHHHETGDPLPDDIVAKIVSSHSSGKEAYDWLRVCAMAYFDHHAYRSDVPLCKYFSDILSQYCPLVPCHETYLHRWGHRRIIAMLVDTTVTSGRWY